MLVLTRKREESIVIGDNVEVMVLGVSGDKVRLGITAPREIEVFRSEVKAERQTERCGSKKPWTPENATDNVILHPKRLDQPLRWTKPRMVFVNSMSDLFHELVPDEYIAQVFTVMRKAENHTFQVLTKRPERMRDILGRLNWRSPTTEERRNDLLPEWQRSGSQAYLGSPAHENGGSYICPNVWLGVSIENRRYVDRADLLRDTRAAVRFISAEPLLGPLIPDAGHMIDAEHTEYPLFDAPTHAWRPWSDDYEGDGLNLEQIDWLIVGGESGPGHRPMSADWVRDLRDYCEDWCWQGDKEGVTSFFFKQWGGPSPKSGGRELDDRTWDQMPGKKWEIANAA